MTALLPCPFCGGGAELHSYEDDDVYTVVCDHCDASGRHYSGASEAIAAWNRRAPSADARAAEATMRERAAKTANDTGTMRWHGTQLEDACDEVAAAIRALPLSGDET